MVFEDPTKERMMQIYKLPSEMLQYFTLHEPIMVDGTVIVAISDYSNNETWQIQMQIAVEDGFRNDQPSANAS